MANKSREDGLKDGRAGKEDTGRSLFDRDYARSVNEGEGIRDREHNKESAFRSVVDKDYAKGAGILQGDLSSDHRDTGGSHSGRDYSGSSHSDRDYSGGDYSGGGSSDGYSSVNDSTSSPQGLWALSAVIANALDMIPLFGLSMQTSDNNGLLSVAALLTIIASVVFLVSFVNGLVKAGGCILGLIVWFSPAIIFATGINLIQFKVISFPSTIYLASGLILTIVSIIFLIKSFKK